MKITICGSMKFYSQMKDLQFGLKEDGHDVELPKGEESEIDFDTIKPAEWINMKQGFIDSHIEKIKQSDAILIANYTKNNKENYIGANTFMEIAFAYLLEKKIYLVNEIPDQPNTEEISAMKPTILNGDLMNIV